MLCYRDRTFCSYWRDCRHGKVCNSALTDEVAAAADAARLPISQFAEQPQCFLPPVKRKRSK